MNILERAYRKLRALFMGGRFWNYMAGIAEENPLKGIRARIVADAFEDPTEAFSHYDAFGYWVASRIAKSGRKHSVLDLGSRKIQVAMLSASHDVTSMVLADCADLFSAVKYVVHDVSNPLPFQNQQFDCFTSTVSLQLIGMGRYGDKLDSNALHNFVRELDRIMGLDADLYLSMCLGPNFLPFNVGWNLDQETICKVFSGWRLVEVLADSSASAKGLVSGLPQRFVRPMALPPIKCGDCWIAFFHFQRGQSNGLSLQQ